MDGQEKVEVDVHSVLKSIGTVEIHASAYIADSKWLTKWGKKIKAAGGRYSDIRGDSSRRYLHIDGDNEALLIDVINSVVEAEHGGKLTIRARDLLTNYVDPKGNQPIAAKDTSAYVTVAPHGDPMVFEKLFALCSKEAQGEISDFINGRRSGPAAERAARLLHADDPALPAQLRHYAVVTLQERVELISERLGAAKRSVEVHTAELAQTRAELELANEEAKEAK